MRVQDKRRTNHVRGVGGVVPPAKIIRNATWKYFGVESYLSRHDTATWNATWKSCNHNSGGCFIVFVRGGFRRGAVAVMVGSIYFCV